jgi:hypothetical protein
MGALTGNAIKDTYLDVVQLGKSGAGLPSHAGKEAALYDGSGAQILGRTAVRHWLNPDPDAISGTWEFSTLGDKTQAQLEALGWTFSRCTAVVANGQMVLTSSENSNNIRAELVVSLNGDFDYIASTQSYPGPSAAYDYISCFKIGIPGGVGHLVSTVAAAPFPRGSQTVSTTYDAASADGTNNTVLMLNGGVMRIARYSGTVFCGAGSLNCTWGLGVTAAGGFGWAGASGAEGSEYTRIGIVCDCGATTGQKYAVNFIRRYA